MANFWDLPRPVRDSIYRLHLVKDDPLNYGAHFQLVEVDPSCNRRYSRKYKPPICLVSGQTDREAAPIYYGENHFVFGMTKNGNGSSVFQFTSTAWPRDLRLIRKVTYQWPMPYTWDGVGNGMAGEQITEIARFRGLQELYIRVDEKAMIRRMLASRRSVQITPPRDLTLQDGVALLRHPGMSSLLKISGVPKVEFIKIWNYSHVETGGPIAGGFLETEILPRLQATKSKARSKRANGSFDFLALPPELRNRIYALLLKFEGPVHPSTKPPSSVAKKRSSKNISEHGSALNILGVSREVYEEACGIFYDSNVLEFYYPIQFQAFVLALRAERLACVRDVTIHYHNVKSGGVDLAELSLPMLKQLKGLRRLRILFVTAGLKNRLILRSWYRGIRYGLRNANPLTLPGMKALFDLRDVEDIVVRDLSLEKEVKSAKEDHRYPDGFGVESLEKACLDLERVLDHVNAALAAAQSGKHNTKLLEDDEWHTRDELPPAKIEIEEVFDDQVLDGEGEPGDARDLTTTRRVRDGTFDGIELSAEPAIGTLRDRLRSSTRSAKKAATDQDGSEELEGEDDIRVTRIRNRNNPELDQIEEPDEEDEAEQKEDDAAAKQDEMEDEIVVKPRTKSGLLASYLASYQAKEAASRVAGLDGAEDDVDEEMEGEEGDDDSYWVREPSPEM